MCHVDLGTEYEGTWLTLTAVHEVEEFQVLLDRTVTERTVGTRTGCRAFLLGNDLRTLLIHISPALFDQPHGKIPEFLEIVAGIIDVSPLESQPLDVIFDALDILCIFLDGVGIVETEVTDTTVFLGQTEVDGNGLGMSDVQVAIGLWWEAGLHSAAVLTFCQVIDDFLLNEANALFFLAFVFNNLFHIFFTFLLFYLFTFI